MNNNENISSHDDNNTSNDNNGPSCACCIFGSRKKRKRWPCQFKYLSNLNDKGFGYYKQQVLHHERLNTIKALKERWHDLRVKANIAFIGETYLYLFCLGEYVEKIVKDDDFVDIEFEEDDFWYLFFRRLLQHNLNCRT